MNKQLIANRLTQVRKIRGLSQRALAEKVGTHFTTISRYERGLFDDIKMPMLTAICRVLNVAPLYLLGESNKMKPYNELDNPNNISIINVPILGTIRAGVPMYAEQNLQGYIYTEAAPGNYFGLRVKGDSMSALGIMDGDIIICREQSEVENGEVAVVLVGDDEATVKRFSRNETTIVLTPQSLNPAHLPQVYDLTKTDVRVLGKVIRVSKEIV